MKPQIVLVGFMGTGKSAVGKKLAEALGLEFIEIDECIEKKEGMSIAEIFRKKGEGYFRKLEKDAIKGLADKKEAVVSAGGGAIIDEENLMNLKLNGVLICLEASPDVILERVKGITTRPLLNVPDPRKRIEELLKERSRCYKKADFSINTDRLSVEQVVKNILDLISKA